MKITGYDEPSGSLIVAFCSDTTLHQDPEQYPALAYQPTNMWPDVTDVQEIVKRIAVSGVYQVESHIRSESLKTDTERVEQYKALVGSTFEFPVSDLLPPAPTPTPEPDPVNNEVVL